MFHAAQHAIYASTCSAGATVLPPTIFEFEPVGITLEYMGRDAALRWLSLSCTRCRSIDTNANFHSITELMFLEHRRENS